MSRRLLVTALMLGLVVGLLLPAAVLAQGNNPDDVLRAGLQKFRQGRYEEALTLFEAVQGMLSSEQPAARRKVATRLVLQASQALLLRLSTIRHADAGIQRRLRGFADYMLSSAEQGVKSFERDQDNIKRDLKRAMNDVNPVRRLEWMKTVADRYGEFAIPEIQRGYFSGGDTTAQGRALHQIDIIGRAAVPPLIEILDSANKNHRMIAAHALGNLGDSRAVPPLLRNLQNDPQVEVKQQCKIALRKILGVEPTEAPAKEAFYALARRYYNQSPDLMYGRTDAWVIWRWVPKDLDDLVKRGMSEGHLDYDHECPLWLYMDVMAAEACLDALALDPNYEAAWDLLACINMQMWLEAQGRLKYATDVEKQTFDKWFDWSHRGLVLSGIGSATAPGSSFGSGSARGFGGQLGLLRAIRLARQDRREEVMIGLMRRLQKIGDSRYVPGPKDYDVERTPMWNPKKPASILVELLHYADKRVQYVAAQTLFTLAPNDVTPDTPDTKEPFAQADIAMNLLISGITETVQRSILLISADVNFRNELQTKLSKLEYFVNASATVKGGLRRAKEFPSDDLLILDWRLAREAVRVLRSGPNEFHGNTSMRKETILDLLKDDPRTGPDQSTGKTRLPVVLLLDMDQLTEDDVNSLREDFKASYDAGQVRGELKLRRGKVDSVEMQLAVLNAIWADKLDDAKGKADQIAIDSAVALGNCDPTAKVHNLLGATEALISRVNAASSSTRVKVACLKTVASFAKRSPNSNFNAEWWSTQVIPSLTGDAENKSKGVLRSDAATDMPIVKSWACRVLANIYTSYGIQARWGPAVDDPNEPFFALYSLLDYDPEGLDAADADEDARRAFKKAVRETRVAAGEALGAAPLTAAQRYRCFSHKRMTRKEKLNYEDPE